MNLRFFAILLWVAAGASSAAAQESEARIPCAADHQLLDGSRLHVACGARLVIVDLRSQRVVSDESLDGPIVGFHRSGERIWVELGDGRARLVSPQRSGESDAGAPSGGDESDAGVESGAAVASGSALESAAAVRPPESTSEGNPPADPSAIPPPPASATDPRPRGRVVSVEDDEVMIDLGRDDGIDVGQRIDVTPPSERGDWLDDEAAIVGVVERVGEGRARVRIRWGQTTEVGAPAVGTDNGEIGSRVAPPAPPRGLSTRGALMVGLPIDDLGIQTLVEGDLTFRARRFFMARAVLRPSGLSIGKDADFGSAGGYLQLGFDHRLVGAAFGVGLERVYDRSAGSFSPRVAFPTSFRVGAIDGLMVEVTTLLTINDGELGILSVDGQAQLPLANGVWLQLRGGGGIASTFWHSEAVVRLALRGNGARGTTSLEIGVGALGTTYRRTPESVDRIGPSLVVGVTHRL